MKDRILILFIIILTASCYQKNSGLPSKFRSIDLSQNSGWHYLYSLNVDSTGGVIIKKVYRKDSVKYFTTVLSDLEMNKIAALVDSANNMRYDSIVESNCNDCSYYQICLTTIHKKQKLMVFGDNSPKYIDSLQSMLSKIIDNKDLKPTAKTFEFESFLGLVPEPIMETKTFIPPVIEPDSI